MTDLQQTTERVVDTSFDERVELHSSRVNGASSIHMDAEPCTELTGADARELAAALLELAEIVDPANPVEAPPVTVTTLPHDDLIYLGVNA
jgi:hypothetical protein